MRALHIQALKAAGLCKVVALAATLGGSGGMLGTRDLMAQEQQAPKPPVAVQAPGSTAPVRPKPRAEELERWRQMIVHTQRPEKACFAAEYPATAWTKVPCGKPPEAVFFARKGPPSKLVGQGMQGQGDVAQSAESIKWAEGSFDAVIGVQSACSAACPSGNCPTNYTCSSGNLRNNYSLQLNTKYGAAIHLQ